MPNAILGAKRLLVGRPLPSDRLEHERLDKKTALAVLSSDAISSVAYATEQILIVLAVLGTMALHYLIPISAVIVGLLMLVALSYRQTIFAYPNGGGSYTVAKDNLGVGAGLVAAAALLTDYILTVAVSISSGIAAITSAYPVLAPWTVTLCVAAIALLAVVNLRGVRESGAAFSVPTYIFIGAMLALLGVGVVRLAMGHAPAPTLGPLRVDVVSQAHGAATGGLLTGFALVFLILRAFAEGCVAMTGTEAISNGVTAFRNPASKNAATTLGWMAAILGVFFIGTSYLARHYGIMPSANETVLSQLGRHVFGGGWAYYLLQYSTFAVLVLAANTAFADFPRLSSLLAEDRYMPHQLAARGDRLAFSNGIVALSLVAILLVWMFHGDTSALIPLYAIGVFLCFTLSQAGMVRHWFAARGDGWWWRAGLNGLGALATALVFIVQIATKFVHGAWIVVLIIPLIIWMLVAIHRHYLQFAEEIKYTGQAPLMFMHHTVVVPVSGITKATAGALVYATTISEDVRAATVGVDPASTAALRKQWEEWDIDVPLVVLESPYRSVIRPIVDYVKQLEANGEADLVTVIVPEIVPHHWWEHLLHNKTALYIRTALLFRPKVVVTAVPYLLGHAVRLQDLALREDPVPAPSAPAP
ncbi:MAG: APC family permease [Gemmatimonadota bacterium]|nr:APC family permease [Gemmatimonadota bacterium]MDE3174134.1 APC family permease [Gemmatimonadota bacterium]MDE3215900.1 APC family permease [Gemmatimonadota bacterium]